MSSPPRRSGRNRTPKRLWPDPPETPARPTKKKTTKKSPRKQVKKKTKKPAPQSPPLPQPSQDNSSSSRATRRRHSSQSAHDCLNSEQLSGGVQEYMHSEPDHSYQAHSMHTPRASERESSASKNASSSKRRSPPPSSEVVETQNVRSPRRRGSKNDSPRSHSNRAFTRSPVQESSSRTQQRRRIDISEQLPTPIATQAPSSSPGSIWPSTSSASGYSVLQMNKIMYKATKQNAVKMDFNNISFQFKERAVVNQLDINNTVDFIKSHSGSLPISSAITVWEHNSVYYALNGNEYKYAATQLSSDWDEKLWVHVLRHPSRAPFPDEVAKASSYRAAALRPQKREDSLNKLMSLTVIILGLEHDEHLESLDSFLHYLRRTETSVVDWFLKAPLSTQKSWFKAALTTARYDLYEKIKTVYKTRESVVKDLKPANLFKALQTPQNSTTRSISDAIDRLVSHCEHNPRRNFEAYPRRHQGSTRVDNRGGSHLNRPSKKSLVRTFNNLQNTKKNVSEMRPGLDEHGLRAAKSSINYMNRALVLGMNEAEDVEQAKEMFPSPKTPSPPYSPLRENTSFPRQPLNRHLVNRPRRSRSPQE